MPSDFLEVMEKLQEYEIKFVSLKAGNHSFNYKIGKEFFEAFEHSEIEESEIIVDLDFEKATTMLVLNFSISGNMSGECAVCLDKINVPLNGEFRQIFKFSDELTESDDEEIAFISTSEISLNVAPYIYEFIHLSLPTRIVHPEGECNDEVQNVLDQYILVEEDDSEASEEIDPRWEALKKLKKD